MSSTILTVLLMALAVSGAQGAAKVRLLGLSASTRGPVMQCD
jgi:hypothetical protein